MSSSSFVWLHAKKIENDRGQCNHCGKTYALGGGTSSLVLHLKNQHANVIKPNTSEVMQTKLAPPPYSTVRSKTKCKVEKLNCRSRDSRSKVIYIKLIELPSL